MSDLLSESEEDGGSRWRAAWALTVLGLIAAIVASIMVFVLGTSPDTESAQRRGSTGGPTSQGRDGGSRSAAPSTSAEPSGEPSPINTAAPCPTTAACIVDGDPGGVVAAINKLRSSNGFPAVAGTVSAAAQQCALAQGTSTSCAPSFAWQPVPAPDGALVVTKIGPVWLLDRGISRVEVGWAYLPGPVGVPGTWECSVLKFS